MPVSSHRIPVLERAVSIFSRQQYPNKELILVFDDDQFTRQNAPTWRLFNTYVMYSRDTSIGGKLNAGIHQCTGEIICRMDDDDWYSPQWVATAVAHLQETGADATGLSSAYFFKAAQDMTAANLWLWEYNGRQPYATGATQVFKRSIWEVNPYPAISEAEDAAFIAMAGRVKPIPAEIGRRLFVAMIHYGNTASHKQIQHFTAVNPYVIAGIMGDDLKKFQIIS